MAQTVRDSTLETRTARARLAVQHKPYFRSLDPGLHLAYRKGQRGGKWSARIYVGKGKYREPAIGTADDKADADGVAVLSYSQAQAAARKLFEGATRSASGLPELPAGPFTVAAAMRDYLDWLEQEGRGADAIADARNKSDSGIVPKLGDHRVDSLTSKQIESWLHGLAKAAPRLRVRKGAKQRHREVDMTDLKVRRQRRSTANRIFGILKAALNKAWRDGKTASDGAWRKVRPFKGATASRAAYLPLDECRRLINACGEDFRDMVRAGLHTGARYSELCRLAPADFNPDSGTVAIRASKSGKPRHIILNQDGRDFYQRAVAKAGDRALLFVRAEGSPWTKSAQHRPMKAACDAARIKPRIGFHGMRHTYASHAIMNGVPLLVVARNLGHADARMCERHYAHLSASFEADAIRAGALRFEGTADNVTPLRPMSAKRGHASRDSATVRR